MKMAAVCSDERASVKWSRAATSKPYSFDCCSTRPSHSSWRFAWLILKNSQPNVHYFVIHIAHTGPIQQTLQQSPQKYLVKLDNTWQKRAPACKTLKGLDCCRFLLTVVCQAKKHQFEFSLSQKVRHGQSGLSFCHCGRLFGSKCVRTICYSNSTSRCRQSLYA